MLDAQYEPAELEQRWIEAWREQRLGSAIADPAMRPFAIMMSPPNVTGPLHWGHGLNVTLQDVLTRWKRMQGFAALWLPGTDHAGTALQHQILRQVRDQGNQSPEDSSSQNLRRILEEQAEANRQKILDEVERTGASCDWRRTQHTQNAGYSNAVRQTFFKLFKDGLIYRGMRQVYGDTFLQTVISDDEVILGTGPGHLWTFIYPVVGSDERISFSCTRPELILADMAIAVHPQDSRYQHLIGKQVRIPIVDRLIPIIADGILIEKCVGTGAVNVTPGHDPKSYTCALRNKLPMVNVLNQDGTVNEEGGRYQGLDLLTARERVVQDMANGGYLIACEECVVEIPHSDRSSRAVESYLSRQWFIRMDALAQGAMDALSQGRLKFYPGRYARQYMERLSEKRDWCISRQLQIGQAIPVWYCETATENDLQVAFAGREDVVYRRDLHDQCWHICSLSDLPGDVLGSAHVLRQDPDVIDSWFSASIWPHAALTGTVATGEASAESGTPLQPVPFADSNLTYFYPSQVLVTARDTITLWVTRMVALGQYLTGQSPFPHVCVHPQVLNGFGQIMSKSTGVNPRLADLLHEYGADAVRFTMASIGGENQDVRLPVTYKCPYCGGPIPQTLDHLPTTKSVGQVNILKCSSCRQKSQDWSGGGPSSSELQIARTNCEQFEFGRLFCRKLWQAARLTLLNLNDYVPEPITEELLELEDRWILSRLVTVLGLITQHLEWYEFDSATKSLRDFTWNEFADWYLELIKGRLRDPQARSTAQGILVSILDVIIRAVAPFAPFIAEEIWQQLNILAPRRGYPQLVDRSGSVSLAEWPVLPRQLRNAELEGRFNRLQETIVAVRNIRAVYGMTPDVPLTLHVRCEPDVVRQQTVPEQFDNLSRTMLEKAGLDVISPQGAVPFTLGDEDGFIPLEGIIDRSSERKRHEKDAEKLRSHIASNQKKLNNTTFLAKARPEVIDQVRELIDSLSKQLESVQAVIAALSDG